MATAPALKLTYFNGAGRAEAIRLALHIGGIAFVDERLAPEQFGQRKASLVYGQLPVLEVDGVQMAQSQALLRYAGKLAGLYPVNDPLAALRVDEIVAAFDEMMDKIAPSMRESDPDKAKAMRLELAQVTLPRYLQLIDARLAKLQTHAIFQSDQIWIHELLVYVYLLQLQSGRLDHIPTDLADQYAHLKAAEAKVLVHPKVQQWNAATHSNAELKLKLTYFDMPGRAEPIRLALVIGGIPFEDERIDHAQLKARRASLPFGQVPVLDVNGEVLSQSQSILRFVGALAGLYPTADTFLALRVDEIMAAIEDINSAAMAVFKKPADQQAAALKELVETTLPRLFGQLDQRVAAWGGPHAVGAPLTIADLLIYGMTAMFKFNQARGFPATILDDFTNLTRIAAQVRDHDKVKDVAWLAQQ